MKILGNIIWWLFGGLEAAIGYFTGSLALACTIIGIPIALQTFKIGLLCLWPFGSTVVDTDSPMGCTMHYNYRYSMGKATLQNGRTFACTFRQRRDVWILIL